MFQVAEQRLLTAAEAAEFLQVGRNSLYILARQGGIPHYRVGNLLRFDLDDLRSWLEESRRGPKAAAQ